MEIVFTPEGGKEERIPVFDFKSPGITMGMYNTDESIAAFAHSSFQVSIATGMCGTVNYYNCKLTLSHDYIEMLVLKLYTKF